MNNQSASNIEETTIWHNHLNSVASRAREKMDELNVDALIALTAENYYYLAGFPSFFLYRRRQAGVSFAVHFRDPNKKTVLIINEFEAAGLPENFPNREIHTYPIWVDVDDPFNIRGSKFAEKRPVNFQIDDVFQKLSEVLSEGGVEKGKVATELKSMQYDARKSLNNHLSNVEFIEASSLFENLRSIKTKWEIDLLRSTANLAETGITESIKLIEPGITAAQLGSKFKRTILADPDCVNPRLNFISVGGDFAPRYALSTYKGKEGDVIKFDVGADIAGYGSDLARPFVIGQASDGVKKIYQSLRMGHDKILDMIGPGIKMSEVFNEAMSVIHQSGLTSYNRGHLGHSTGLTIEEAPFVSPNEVSEFKPGMVVCFETPYYAYGIGSIMIEDMILITEDGYENFNKRSRDLIEL